MILRFAWRNLWRNPRRTFITVTSVGFAVFLAIAMKSLQTGVFDHMVRNMVNYYSGYLQIHKQGYWKERMIDNSFLVDSVIRKQLSSRSDVGPFVSRIETAVLVSTGNTTREAYLCGTDPDDEAKLTGMHNRIVSGTWFGSGSGVLLAEGLARRLKLQVGDSVVILGQGLYGSMAAGIYFIRGIVKLGSPELNEAFILMELPMAQELLSAPGRVTAIALNPADEGRLAETVTSLSGILGDAYEVMSWQTMMPEVHHHIEIDTNSLAIMMGFLYLIIAFGMFGTVLMMTNERKYEFGMLVAIGMKKEQLGLMLTAEILLMTLLGTAAGVLFSWPVVWYLEAFPLQLGGELARAFSDYGFEPTFPARLDAGIFGEQTLIVAFLALLMSIYPLLTVVRLNPTVLIKR